MAVLTFKNMYERLQDFVRDHSAQTLVEIKAELNTEYQRLTEGAKWNELVKTIESDIQLVANQGYLALPGDCDHVDLIADETNDNVYVDKSWPKMVQDEISTKDSAKSPRFYSQLGRRPTKRPLSADSAVTVLKEQSGNDIVVRIVGLRADKEIPAYEDITTSGTTPVAGSITFRKGWHIDMISIPDPTADNDIITVREGATVIADIPDGQRSPQYFIVRFDGVPTTANTLTVVYKRAIGQLIDDDDVPLVPRLGEAIVEATKGKMREADKKYTQAETHRSNARALIASMQSNRELQPKKRRQFRPDFTGKCLRREF